MTRASKAWCLFYVSLFVIYFRLVRACFPEPYMDEYFHVRQTLQYVTKHDFITWDPKITTPPGLYVVGFLACKLFGPSLPVLRSVNLVSILVTLLWPLTRRSRSRAGPLSRVNALDGALIVCGLPLLALYGSLYYTDVLSTLLVVRGMSASSPVESASVFLASLWFRQTNIVWTGAAAAIRAVGSERQLSALITDIKPLLLNGIRIAPSYLAVLGLFVGFLKWNGSIALGDKSNHGVSLHFAQALYFLLFFSLFSAPLLLKSVLKGGRPRLVELFGRLYLVPLELAAIYGIIKYGTVVHPFILSDNRHYTFYIWRRLITPLGGLMILPVYWVSWRWFAATVNFRLLKTWVVIAAVLAVLVPSPLMEPRYYIVPYLVWRLHLHSEPGSGLEHAWNAVINCATMGIFCFSKTHFMW